MNPFEALPDDPILHILSYLPRNDLLSLTLTDTKFNRIITESRETKTKIPLMLKCNRQIGIEDVIELAHKRRFTALTMKYINVTIAEDFVELFQILKGSIEHLDICAFQFCDDTFNKIIQTFLPTLKTCNIGFSGIFTPGSCSIAEVSNYPLTSLRIGNSGMVKFFGGCTQLKSFEFRNKGDTDYIYDFVAQQQHLEKLKCDARNVDLSRMTVVQLKELTLTHYVGSEVAEYIKKCPNLKKLHIEIFSGSPVNRIMKAICSAPKLESLGFMILYSNPTIALERLQNTSVKVLRISDGETVGWFLQIFRGAEVVSIDMRRDPFKHEYYANLCDPSDVTQESIDKVEFRPNEELFRIMFSPHQIPVNVHRFETAVMKFVKMFATRITSVTIGHDEWLKHRNFKLSNSFCEELINALPRLVKLELYNIANHRDFHFFLHYNRLLYKSLKETKLHRINYEV